MKTLHKTAKDISDNSLFVRGGTLDIEHIKALFAESKYPYCKSVYKRKILDMPDELKSIVNDKPVWYESRSGGVKFYTINEQAVREPLQDRYKQIKKVWNNLRPSQIIGNL